MALDPVLQQLIDQLPTVPPGPVDYPSLRQQAAAMIPLIVGPGGRIEVASVEDRQIEAGGEIVPLRIYRPATKAVGTLHYIHGGGWAIGDLDTVDHTVRRLCRDLSMVVVASSYRLAPENPFPAAFDDSLAAARWVAANRADLGGAAAPAVIAGDSAGGKLGVAEPKFVPDRFSENCQQLPVDEVEHVCRREDKRHQISVRRHPSRTAGTLCHPIPRCYKVIISVITFCLRCKI